MKAVSVLLAVSLLMAGVPVVLAGPPEPPMQEFLVLYFQAEQEIARARLDKPTKDTLYLLLDSAWTAWMYAEYAANKAVADARALKMVRAVLSSIKELRNGAPGIADAASGKFTLLMVFQYSASCQMFPTSGGRYYICQDGAVYHWRGLSVERWTNE